MIESAARLSLLLLSPSQLIKQQNIMTDSSTEFVKMIRWTDDTHEFVESSEYYGIHSGINSIATDPFSVVERLNISYPVFNGQRLQPHFTIGFPSILRVWP